MMPPTPRPTALPLEPNLDQPSLSQRIDDLLDQWTPVAHKLLPAGAAAAQLPDYTYALLEGLATAAAMPERERAAFLNAHRVWLSGQREALQALVDRLPPDDAAERRRLSWLLSPKASDRRRAICLAAALEFSSDDRPSSAQAPIVLPAYAAFGLQLWAEGFSYAQFMGALKLHRQRHAPAADVEAETAAAAPLPNLVYDFYYWRLERDGYWRRGDYAVALNPEGATLQFKGRAVQHYADPLQAVAACDQQARESGHAGQYEAAEVTDWLASLKMPQPEQASWQNPGTAGQDLAGQTGDSRLALILFRGHSYALIRKRPTNLLAFCPIEGEQVGPPLAVSETHLEINWWLRRGNVGRQAIIAWMLKKAEL